MAKWNIHRPGKGVLTVEAEDVVVRDEWTGLRDNAERIVAVVYPEPGLIITQADAEKDAISGISFRSPG